MNTKNLLSTVLLSFTLVMILVTSLSGSEEVMFLSPRHCCTVQIQKVDDTVSYVIYRNNEDYDGYEEYQLNSRLPDIIKNMEDYCNAHHPEL